MEEELLMMKIYFKLYQKDEKEEDNYHITKISKNGTLYIGNVDSNGNFKGKGVYREDNTIYAGFWNVSDSRFFMIYKNGVIQYKGELKDKTYHGRGTLYKNGALYYKGEFINGKNRDMEFYTVMLKASSFRPNLRTIPLRMDLENSIFLTESYIKIFKLLTKR